MEADWEKELYYASLIFQQLSISHIQLLESNPSIRCCKKVKQKSGSASFRTFRDEFITVRWWCITKICTYTLNINIRSGHFLLSWHAWIQKISVDIFILDKTLTYLGIMLVIVFLWKVSLALFKYIIYSTSSSRCHESGYLNVLITLWGRCGSRSSKVMPL